MKNISGSFGTNIGNHIWSEMDVQLNISEYLSEGVYLMKNRIIKEVGSIGNTVYSRIRVDITNKLK